MNLEHEFKCDCPKCYNEFLPIGERNITELRAKKLVELAEQEGGLKQYITGFLEELPNYNMICDCTQKRPGYDEDLGGNKHRDVCLRCGGIIIDGSIHS